MIGSNIKKKCVESVEFADVCSVSSPANCYRKNDMTKIDSVRAPLDFDIKSSNLPLVAFVLRTTDLKRLNIEFQQRFRDMPGFFDQDGVIIDL